jgi:hypothetical protein
MSAARQGGKPMSSEINQMTNHHITNAPAKGNADHLAAPQVLDLIWGAKAIAVAIGKTERATFHLLEQGKIPARKIGGQWATSRGKLRAHFEQEAI